MTRPRSAGPARLPGGGSTLWSDAGLTLIEMLVVLAIIGIASGATVLAFSPKHAIEVEVEARRLAGEIQRAADATLVSDAPAIMLVDASGYRVGQAARHVLPVGMRIDGAPATAVPLTLGDTAAVDLTVARGDDAWAVSFDGLRATAVARGARQ